jgi:succinoglycan biosynthesis transport protein ExoP
MIGAPSPREHLVSLGSFALRAARALRFGGLAAVIGLVGTAAWVLSTARIYRSEAVIVYERGVQASSMGDTETPRQMGSRLNDMVMSRTRIQTLIKDMNLYPRTVDRRGLVEAIDEMRRRLTVSVREGYTFRVAFDGESRDLAKNVLDGLLASVVAEDRQRRLKETEEAKRFLDAERAHADADVKLKESALASFLTQHPQLASEMGGGAASAGGLIRAADRDRMGSSGGEVATLELQAAQLEESLAAMGHRPGARANEPPVDAQLIAAQTRAQAELHTAQRELADKQTTLTNEHPDVKHALKRLALAEAAERRANAAIAAWRPSATPDPGTVVTGIDSGNERAAAMRRALAAIRSQISAIRSRATPRAELPKAPGSAVAIDTDWTRLNREVSEARERQNQIEAKQFQAQLAATLAAEGQGGQLVVVDPPFKPLRPIAGGHFKIALAGVGASIMLGLLVMLLFAIFDERLYGARDLQNLISDGIIVVIPKIPPKLTAKGG